jgi:hypothetical protein
MPTRTLDRQERRQAHTGNKLPHPTRQVEHALANVTNKGEEASEETENAADEGVDDGVCGVENRGQQLADGLDEIGYGACDSHFLFISLYFWEA